MNNSRPSGLQGHGRAGALVAVVLAHAGLLLGLTQLQLAPDRAVERDPLQVALVMEAPDSVAPPEPPKPRFEPPQVDAIPPEVIIEWVPEAAKNAITLNVPREPSAAPQPAGSEPVLVSEVEYVRPPRPSYPPAARKRRQEGLVVLKVVVDAGGHAAAVEVYESSGHPLLDSAACDAVRQTRFRPYVENGRARPMRVMVPIEFRLNNRVASSRDSDHGS